MFSNIYEVLAYGATLLMVYYAGKSRGKAESVGQYDPDEEEEEYEEEEELEVQTYNNMERERQLWRTHAQEQALAKQLKEVRKRKKTLMT